MTVDPSKFEREANGFIKKGSGGRIAGSRNKLSHAFLADALESWAKNGKAALEITFREKPDVYFKVMAKLIPRELILSDGGKIDTISEDDLDAALSKILEERKRLAQEEIQYAS